MILRRILEPIVLGSVANLIINFIFNPYSYEFRLDELAVACILSIPITELNRYIDKKLERRFNWITHPRKRFVIHLVLISSGMLICLNVLGNAYVWITQQGFFSWKEAGLINLVTLCLAILLTMVNWSFHFYSGWKNAEATMAGAFRTVNNLERRIVQQDQFIELQKGSSKIKVESKTVRIATIELGVVRVYADKDQYGVFAGTLTQLYSQLPDYWYFQVTRDTILHRDVIKTISSSTFGKIDLTIYENDDSSPSIYTVSRPKAAAFRRWYNSNSTKKR
jgi:LytTr DNA-binding domain